MKWVMSVDKQGFANSVVDSYGRLNESPVIKASARGQEVGVPSLSPPVGHPSFASLRIGETATCELAVAFLDMRGMTARSFWQPLEQVTRLSLAVLGQIAEVVRESGGFVLGMRGDGLMAGWGDPYSDRDVDISMAMAACSFSLDAVESALNETLRLSGLAPVQVSAGVDYGELCFARTGTPDGSEVNVVGHAANFSAKCEKIARSWEVVVGEGAADRIQSWLLTRHERSPKTYTLQGQHRHYAFYQFAWRRVRQSAATAISQVRGRSTGSIDVDWEEMT